jgi:hypothetical protein
MTTTLAVQEKRNEVAAEATRSVVIAGVGKVMGIEAPSPGTEPEDASVSTAASHACTPDIQRAISNMAEYFLG